MAADSHGSSDGSHLLDPAYLIGHVKDATYFEMPKAITSSKSPGKLKLPQPFHEFHGEGKALISSPSPELIEHFELKVTKFMVLELVAAVIVGFLAIGLARNVRGGKLPTGRLWHALEGLLLFLRDEVARPAIGKADADRFLPFLWSVFFFVLICNLLGMVPWLGSPTGALGCTAMLALITMGVVISAGSKKLGIVGFWKAQVPHMDVPFVLGIFLIPMVFVIEVVGMLIKHFVLAVRLLANMFAGHLVLGVLIAFVGVIVFQTEAYLHPLAVSVAGASILGAIAISLLELFVAFLQAYIFTFLAALFIGMAVHPH